MHNVSPSLFVPQITPLTNNVVPSNLGDDEPPYYGQLYKNEVEYEIQSDAKYDYDEDHTEHGAKDDDDQVESKNNGGNGYDNRNEDEIDNQPEKEGQPVNELHSISTNAPCETIEGLVSCPT